ncbi:hypothetical protein BHE74_00001260 [Ensete ventricosum]|nr:hypothetical protein GW17_00018905 [Ensete ventricosum]RWW89698.1 hypothetical protein BHE74_00001260 [Ensete ventricosum]
MTGGLAYILDEDDTLIPKVHEFILVLFASYVPGQQGNSEDSEGKCPCWTNAAEELDRSSCGKENHLVVLKPYVANLYCKSTLCLPFARKKLVVVKVLRF